MPRAGSPVYRLVERPGLPHPCLDDVYDSLDAAMGDALSWWQGCRGPSGSGCLLGVEVRTRNGDWRTLQLQPCPSPCLPGCASLPARTGPSRSPTVAAPRSSLRPEGL
ncbi:MAG: hypothetical protein VKK62_02555 [Synechococcaceae cyanobacterium]|nr:hypothetical protein [Synechococcaceae cyanobacterium]